MKPIAILIYPEFSLQEIADLLYLFRWNYNIHCEMIATSDKPVYSEEGVRVLPSKTTANFRKEDYTCLVLPGCSDFRESLRDNALKSFLSTFKEETEFVIGAICSAPIFLAQAGLLVDKQFTNSLYEQANQHFSFIDESNRVYAPIVVDGNIITAVGNAFRLFAIEVARAVGFECPDTAMQGVQPDWKPEDFKAFMSDEDDQEFVSIFKDLF